MNLSYSCWWTLSENDFWCTILQKCPFEAIQIINLPKDLAKDTTHRYGANGFKLHRLANQKFLPCGI